MAGVNDLIPDVKPGDDMKASWGQAVADNVNRLIQIHREGVSYLLANAAGEFQATDRPDDLIFLSGDAVNTIPPYGVVLRNGVSTDKTPVPKVKQPDTYGCQNNFFINAGAKVLASGYGTAQLGSGNLFIAAYNTADGFVPAPGEMWGPSSGSYLIRKNYGGFIIDGVYDSTNSWVYVRSMPMTTVRGKVLTSDVASGASGILSVFTGPFGSEAQPLGNPTIANVKNDSSCVVKANKMSRIMINPDINVSGNPWSWTDAYTS